MVPGLFFGAGSWKLEAGSWKLEAGSWKLEAGSQELARVAGLREGPLPSASRWHDMNSTQL
ncbi:MAG: hypothetical protein CMK80_08325 [Pseudomonadales bacterium]|nr:hypothetical protein [Pseudomonadales bacterium]